MQLTRVPERHRTQAASDPARTWSALSARVALAQAPLCKGHRGGWSCEFLCPLPASVAERDSLEASSAHKWVSKCPQRQGGKGSSNGKLREESPGLEWPFVGNGVSLSVIRKPGRAHTLNSMRWRLLAPKGLFKVSLSNPPRFLEEETDTKEVKRLACGHTE